METTTEILTNLHKMFGQNTHFITEVVLKCDTDTKMEKGTRVCDYFFKIMDYLNKVEIHSV